ncbi:FAD-dependent oxidoreductase [Candidatus Woesearchaeota archaeon]|nr:FAD-dependent oxidoreductase [Candidatus Woesearchaeota archaeon]
MYDVVIIGSGIAGLNAGLYAARASLKVLIIGSELGGNLNRTHKIDNWIGEPGISGLKLLDKSIKHAKQFGVEIVDDEVTSVIPNGENFSLVCRKQYEAKTVIFANGMQNRQLNIKGEDHFLGSGVHYCYTCDGPFYKNKVVAVIGGGDSAILAALFMDAFASKVYLINKNEKCKAEEVLLKKMKAMKKLEILNKTNVLEVKGKKFVETIILDNKTELKVDGIFVEIGAVPMVNLTKDLGLKLDDKQFIIVDKEMRTNVPGIYAAGDITNCTMVKQYITAAAQGAIAAKSVFSFLKTK